MLLLLLNYVVLRALWKIDVHLISTLVNKSLVCVRVHLKFNRFTGTFPTCVLYTNIDLKLRNKLHGPIKIGVTCVYNGHVFYTLL